MQILKPPNILMKVIPAYFLNASGNDTAHACQAICTGISAVCTGFTLYKNNTKNGTSASASALEVEVVAVAGCCNF